MSESQSPAERLMKVGYNVDLKMYQGIIIPNLIQDKVQELHTFKMRQDDVLLVSFPKSGTHWVWEILKMAVGGRAEYAEHWQNSSWLEYRTQEDLDQLESPRVLHTHLPPKLMPSSLWDLKCKIVYVQRNPKDVFVSAYNQNTKQSWKDLEGEHVIYSGTWDDFIHCCIDGVTALSSWFDHVKEWNRVADLHPGVDICHIQYEDMKQDCLKEVRKMGEYLGAGLSDNVYADIVDACSFHKLKQASEHSKDQTFHYPWQKGSEGYFRKGAVGDWKNYFTVAQSERMDRVYEDKMKQKFPY